jgi:hypothetical protein
MVGAAIQRGKESLHGDCIARPCLAGLHWEIAMIKFDYDQTNHSCGSLHRRGDLGVHYLSDHAHVALASLTPGKTSLIRQLRRSTVIRYSCSRCSLPPAKGE